ncbi:MAG: DUF1036 domain-containing protein [Synergistaceae bacterium]|nr:DUF1036 domain-containing protein [Synergistaceae bacterium]
MRGTLKAAILIIAVFIMVSAFEASAATIRIVNGVNTRLSITLTYVDKASGALVTKGWWHVAPDGETSITLNADESRGIYFAAYNKDQYYDSAAKKNAQIRRWVSRHTFTYSSDAQPDDDTTWQGKFFKINGNTVNIDSKTR